MLRNDITFGHVSERKDVADLEGSFRTAIDKLTSVHAFRSNEVLFHRLGPEFDDKIKLDGLNNIRS